MKFCQAKSLLWNIAHSLNHRSKLNFKYVHIPMSNKLVGLGQHSSLELTILWSRHRHASFRNFKNVILLSQQDSEKKCSLVVEIWNLSTNLAYNKTSWVNWGLFLPKQCHISLTLGKLEKYFWLEQLWTVGSRSHMRTKSELFLTWFWNWTWAKP